MTAAQRLRDCAEASRQHGHAWAEELDAAADRIEALEARNRALEEELRRLHDVVCDEDARSIREALDA